MSTLLEVSPTTPPDKEGVPCEGHALVPHHNCNTSICVSRGLAHSQVLEWKRVKKITTRAKNYKIFMARYTVDRPM